MNSFKHFVYISALLLTTATSVCCYDYKTVRYEEFEEVQRIAEQDAAARRQRLEGFIRDIQDKVDHNLRPVDRFNEIELQDNATINDFVFEFITVCYKLMYQVENSEFINNPQAQQLLTTVKQLYESYIKYLRQNYYKDNTDFWGNIIIDLTTNAIQYEKATAPDESPTALEKIWQEFLAPNSSNESKIDLAKRFLDKSIEYNSQQHIQFAIDRLNTIGFDFANHVNTVDSNGMNKLDHLFIHWADNQENIQSIYVLMQNGAKANLILDPKHPNFEAYEGLRVTYNQIMAELGLH